MKKDKDLGRSIVELFKCANYCYNILSIYSVCIISKYYVTVKVTWENNHTPDY